jgi:hypothetical protein
MPPRPVRHFGCVGALIVLAAAILVFAVVVWLWDSVPFGVLFTLLLVFVGLLIGSVLIANDRLRARPWIEGQIVPARVYIAPSGPPASLVWHALGVLPVVGFLMGFVAKWAEGTRNAVHVVWCRDGRVEMATLGAGRMWKFYRERLDIWICVTPKGKAIPLQHIAPRQFHDIPVSGDATSYLDTVLPDELRTMVEARKADLIEGAMRDAAKANRRTARRTRDRLQR